MKPIESIMKNKEIEITLRLMIFTQFYSSVQSLTRLFFTCAKRNGYNKKVGSSKQKRKTNKVYPSGMVLFCRALTHNKQMLLFFHHLFSLATAIKRAKNTRFVNTILEICTGYIGISIGKRTSLYISLNLNCIQESN